MKNLFVISERKFLISHVGAYWKKDIENTCYGESNGNRGRYQLIVLVDGHVMEFLYLSEQKRNEEYERLEREICDSLH